MDSWRGAPGDPRDRCPAPRRVSSAHRRAARKSAEILGFPVVSRALILSGGKAIAAALRGAQAAARASIDEVSLTRSGRYCRARDHERAAGAAPKPRCEETDYRRCGLQRRMFAERHLIRDRSGDSRAAARESKGSVKTPIMKMTEATCLTRICDLGGFSGPRSSPLGRHNKPAHRNGEATAR